TTTTRSTAPCWTRRGSRRRRKTPAPGWSAWRNGWARRRRLGAWTLIRDTLASRDSEAYPVSRPKGKQYAFTFASTIMVRAVEPEFHVAPGPPHATAYEKLSFSKRKESLAAGQLLRRFGSGAV